MIHPDRSSRCFPVPPLPARRALDNLLATLVFGDSREVAAASSGLRLISLRGRHPSSAVQYRCYATWWRDHRTNSPALQPSSAHRRDTPRGRCACRGTFLARISHTISQRALFGRGQGLIEHNSGSFCMQIELKGHSVRPFWVRSRVPSSNPTAPVSALPCHLLRQHCCEPA